ncbi:hypothetical protein BOX15_Mlig004361g2 [Macrostomum lignano]|uniref:C2H2-type domain-containing protein n=1 Tax=Macrostomum lignano TaxID=282301 RepID=A0A267H1Z1_9PLAT|nr:hypothetical protein BOX15_Mlig004361g2 [Macrostomum lignano]
MLTSASVTSSSQLHDHKPNSAEAIPSRVIKSEKLDLDSTDLHKNVNINTSNGELSFDSHHSSGDDFLSDRKFRRKNSRPQKVTMIADQNQSTHNRHKQSNDLPQQVEQIDHQSALVAAQDVPNAADADPFASLVIDAPDPLAVTAVPTVAVQASSSLGLCETCGSPLSRIKNGRSDACDFIVLCIDCTCNRISLLLEESGSCERGAPGDAKADTSVASGSGTSAGNAASVSSSIYACRLCQPPVMFASSRLYLEHYMCEHEKVTLKVEASTPADDELDADAAIAAAAEAYRCSHCGLGFRSEDDVEQHERFHLECEFDANRLRCYYCCKEFNELDALNAHQRAHSTERPHQCTVCDRSFSFACTLQRHMLVHQAFHSTYTCHYCDQTFSDAGQLDRHFDVCERNMDDAAGLSPTDGSKPGAPNRFLPYSHTCSTCGKSFRLAWRYKLHMRAACNTADKYNADSDRTCSICKKMFANPMNLHRHELIHAGIRNYQCKLCGKAFVQKTQLETHMNIHNGIKPFQCEVCSKTFTDRSTFHKHKKIHGKPKSFPCTVCGKVFNQAGYLKLHAKVHGAGDGGGTDNVTQRPLPAIQSTEFAVAAAASASGAAASVAPGLTYCNLDQL